MCKLRHRVPAGVPRTRKPSGVVPGRSMCARICALRLCATLCSDRQGNTKAESRVADESILTVTEMSEFKQNNRARDTRVYQ